MRKSKISKPKKEAGLEEAKKIANFTLAKSADNVIILELKKISNICDYCIICSGDSPAQVKAIYNETVKRSRKEKINILHSEVDNGYSWILIDYVDIMLHIFSKEARNFYNLEYLWKQAKKINFRN